MSFFFFKQKTAYEMRISDWSSTCALPISTPYHPGDGVLGYEQEALDVGIENAVEIGLAQRFDIAFRSHSGIIHKDIETLCTARKERSEEHTSELQSLMRISYAVFCLHKKTQHQKSHTR